MSAASTNLSQTSSEDDDITCEVFDLKLLRDLGKFHKTSFSAFLHYTLDLVGAVPKRDCPPVVDEINNDLGVSLTSIIAAMENTDNEMLMQSIEEGLQSYCQGRADSEVSQREGLVKAINAALILLQPVSIGNSRPAANPYSGDFPFFVAHKEPVEGSERMPAIVCTASKHVVKLEQNKNSVGGLQILEDITSKSQNGHVVERKHHHSCWECLRGAELLNIRRPAHYSEGTGYPAVQLRGYGHTDPSLGNEYGDMEAGQVDAHPLNAKRCADDAAKAFYNTLGRDHIINVAINDNLLRVWYFNHESPIQTSAFNFVDDLPYFLLFLFALQRFSHADWGYVTELSPANLSTVEPINVSEYMCNNDDTHGEAIFSRLDHSHEGYRSLSLCGRATHVLCGRLTSDADGLKDAFVVLKLSWRQKVRFPEGTFLQEAMKRLRETDFKDACDYLPTLLGERDFPEFSTDIIRKRLMIPFKEEETRRPYFIILPWYEPLISRTTDWEEYFEHHVALIYCHFMLWNAGIEHGDISTSNLMWDPHTKKPKLCDFDLSHFSDHDKPPGFTNTGTWRFMATDLLRKSAMDGRVKRLYRHDLESFIAVLVWVMFCYDEGALKYDMTKGGTNPLEAWNNSDYHACGPARMDTYESLRPNMPPSTRIPLPIWRKVVRCAAHCITVPCLAVISRQAMKDAQHKQVPVPAEDLEKHNYFNSTAVIERFLDELASETIGSNFLQGIKQKIAKQLDQQKALNEGL